MNRLRVLSLSKTNLCTCLWPKQPMVDQMQAIIKQLTMVKVKVSSLAYHKWTQLPISKMLQERTLQFRDKRPLVFPSTQRAWVTLKVWSQIKILVDSSLTKILESSIDRRSRKQLELLRLSKTSMIQCGRAMTDSRKTNWWIWVMTSQRMLGSDTNKSELATMAWRCSMIAKGTSLAA